MADNEIIKAFEYCSSHDDCDLNCPIEKETTEDEGCIRTIGRLALDIINRQKTEIEGYKESIREYAEMLAEKDVQIKMLQNENEAFAPLGKLYSEIKADAYKEFVDRLKKKVHEDLFGYVEADVQNLLAELTEKGR